MSRRYLHTATRIVPILVLVVALLLSACAAPVAQQPATNPAADSSAADTAPVELSVYPYLYTPGVARGEGLDQLTQFTRIAEEYMKLHPNVKIRTYVAPQAGNHMEWTLPQLSGGTAPDIINMSNEFAYQYKDNNWFVDLMPYLEEPNPYVEGNTRWMDLFFEGTTKAKVQANGALYGLPIDIVATGVVYNKNIFDELGLEPPQTWAEFMTMLQEIEDAGYVPFVQSSPMDTIDWEFVILFEGTALDVIQGLDTLDPNGFTNHEEVCRGVEKGILDFNDPQQHEWLRLLADWSQYFQDDWTVQKDHLNLFLTGRGAMTWVTTGSIVAFLNDPLRDFEFSSFWFPPVTTESSEFGTGEHIRGIGGAHGTQYTVTNSAIEGNKVDAAVDFLRFLSAPQNAIPMIEEANVLAPNVVGDRSTDLLDGMLSSITTEAGPGEQLVFLGFYDQQAGDLGHRTVQQVAAGTMSVEEGAAELQNLLVDACQRLIQDNPDWDQTNW